MTFNLKVVTPYGEFYNGQCSLLYIKSSEGFLTILPNHAPIVTMVDIAPLEFINGDGVREICSCSNGLLYVNRENVTLLVRSIEYKKNIDIERAKNAMERAKKLLEVETADFKRAELALKRALNRISLLEKKD